MEIKTNSKELMKKLLLICERQKDMWEYTDKLEEVGKMAKMGDMCYVRLAPGTVFERGQYVVVKGL